MSVGKWGIVALAFAFLASGVMNLTKPGNNWKPPANDPDKAPPPELIRRSRIMGGVWVVLGLLLAAYILTVLMR